MRILHVIPTLSKGGAERVVIELANASSKFGDKITVLLAYPVDYNLNQRFLKNEVKINFISSKSLFPYLQYIVLPFWIWKNRKFIQDFDVVHCHLTFGLIFGSLLYIRRKISRSKTPKLIATCHMVGVRGSLEYVNRLFSYFFDSFVLMALDCSWRKFIKTYKRKNIFVIANGISTDEVAKSFSKPRIGSPTVIGTISRLEAERRPWLFVEVFSEVAKLDSTGEFKFIIGGDGEERERLENLAKVLNIEGSLMFAGTVNTPKDFFSKIDIYVSLNVEDSTGIAGLEAVFAGLPVVAIQLSPEYSTGESDWIWSSRNLKLVAKKILELSNDTMKTRELILYQYQYASSYFSTQRMHEAYNRLYESS